MNKNSIRWPCILLALLLTGPLAAQWAAPVIALHLRVDEAGDQLGLGERPFSDYYGGVDREGNLVIKDPMKKRLLIYSPQGVLIGTIIAPDSVKKADEFWPSQLLVHPTLHRLLVKSGTDGYCLFSYDGIVHRCFPDPRQKHPWGTNSLYMTGSGFVFHEFFSVEATADNPVVNQTSLRDKCYLVSDTMGVVTHRGECPIDPDEWMEIGYGKTLLISEVAFRASEMAKPDGWHYVLLNHSIAVGQCGDDKCSYAGYQTDGKRIASLKLPFNEMRFDLAPTGDVYSIRQFRHNDVIIYKRAWMGPGAKPAAATPATTQPRPMYYEREIVFEELDGRTLRELDLMRNTIYARAGNPFRKKWLHDYFAAFDWYHPLERMDESKLTPLDRTNARMIMEYGLHLNEADLRDTAGKLQKKAATGKLTTEESIEVRLLSIRLGKWFGPENESAEYQPNPLENPKRLDKVLTLEDLSDLSRRDLRLLRNTVYARRGKPFKSVTLGTYFGDMEWYKPDAAWSESKLTKTDRQNAAVILSLERTLGGPMSEQEALSEQSLEGA